MPRILACQIKIVFTENVDMTFPIPLLRHLKATKWLAPFEIGLDFLFQEADFIILESCCRVVFSKILKNQTWVTNIIINSSQRYMKYGPFESHLLFDCDIDIPVKETDETQSSWWLNDASLSYFGAEMLISKYNVCA